MNLWAQFPLIRLIIPFIAGIVTAIYFPAQYRFLNYLTYFLFTLIALITLFPKLNFSYKRKWISGSLIVFTFFISAYQLTISKTERFAVNHFSKYTDSTQTVIARLTDPYIEKGKTVKAVMEIIALKQGNEWKYTRGKAMVYISKNAESLKLKYGDEVMMITSFKEVPPSQNPGEFDYKTFLSYHNVYHQTFVKSGEWINTGTNNGWYIYKYANEVQNNLLKILVDNHLQGNELAVGAAILLGYKDKLDADIIQSYASTGAIHVLIVAGLHVGIIYFVLNWLLFFFERIKYGNILKAIVLISLVWFYAMLTGLAPSVLRAATMFSFIIVAKSFNRNSNIYNTLAASAFLLLIINPYLLMEAGFQLSYLAVIGIVYLQPKIKELFESDYRLLDKIWELTCVALAAQIATFPLGLHYFHQFPNYFLLSNIIVIPLYTLIMYAGISLIAFAKISVAAKYLALAFGAGIGFLNSFLKFIEKLPHSLVQGISITAFETCIIYILLIMITGFLVKKQKGFLIVAASSALVLLSSFTVRQYNEYHQKRFIVYNIPKVSALDFISAKSNVLLTDTVFAKDADGLLYHIKHNWWDKGINKTKIISSDIDNNNLMIRSNYIIFYNLRIVIITNKPELKLMGKLTIEPIQISYLIVSKNPTLKMESLLKIYKTKVVVFDSSNSLYHLKKWKEECMILNQEYYSVNDSGALVVDL